MHTPTRATGHTPTLTACFLHFDVCFMLWVLVGALGIYVAESAGLGAAQKGLFVAVPILTGSLLRVPLGLLSDRIGGKRVGIGILVFLLLPLALGWRGGHTPSTLFVLGAMLGVAGASFAVVLPLASRWYPAERQGLVMGIAAAGNSGTVLANVFAPRLADSVGWHNVFGLALLPLTIVLLLFVAMAKDSPQSAVARPVSHYLGVLKQADTWWFCLFYSVTFGGYVGLSSFLPLFLRDHFGVSPVTAGSLTAVAALVGSLARPIGGYLADKIGGAGLLQSLLLGIGLTYAAVASLPPLAIVEALLIVGMACLGMGNGAVFQLVPQRFRAEIGVATGVVGAVGGLGGFLLPALLGQLKQGTGSFGPGFLVLAVMASGALVSLQALVAFRSGWRVSWRIARVSAALEEG
ncbi:MAG: MFS transporter [Acidobacteria bacterium RIFCSPLOWO2_12_FULL_65_11]|nr:MAG: MFS transporter [Acidobacteria bacterium RIFCSPLOWO2_02_FULL_64_15]OFW30504.1 MAG: MFS transporter [Acidobacteria bacterium RIFCSPLOWO2_12_FULL_65_11]